MSVTCRVQAGGLEVRIRDRGRPFDIAAAPDLPPDALREGGRGVFLIRRLMDEVESCPSDEGGNELRLFRRRP
jgi:anti-sigma regulatory factor (Ser/Thr protein kinase)